MYKRLTKEEMLTMTREEVKAHILNGIYDALPDPPKPKPKPKLEADVLPFPPILSEQELCRRQEVVNAAWERHVVAQRELDAEWAQSCHRAPGDPDYTEPNSWVWNKPRR
jgi:hypothetical protein